MCKCDKNNPDKSCDNCRGGRPEKYYPEVVDELIEYFDISPGYDVEAENSKGIMMSVRHAADFPTLAGFAISIGVGRTTLYDWATRIYPVGHEKEGQLKHPEFSKAYKRVSDFQEYILVTNGLKGGYNANFAKFTAQNVIGWRDNRDIKLAGDKEAPIQHNVKIEAEVRAALEKFEEDY